jgi:hypothetical protein
MDVYQRSLCDTRVFHVGHVGENFDAVSDQLYFFLIRTRCLHHRECENIHLQDVSIINVSYLAQYPEPTICSTFATRLILEGMFRHSNMVRRGLFVVFFRTRIVAMGERSP